MTSATDTLFIVGLGNPGPRHAGDRHNVGFWLADQLAAHIGGRFTNDRKLGAESCRGMLASQPAWIIKPATFMNRSGQCVRAVLDYYNATPDRLLVVHDELDLPPGTARLKRGGGHGGHNGLRDIVAHCGPDFLRLRVGIGHPGNKDQVTDYVLHPPTEVERALILDALAAAVGALEKMVAAGLEPATQQLHTQTPRPGDAAEFGPAG